MVFAPTDRERSRLEQRCRHRSCGSPNAAPGPSDSLHRPHAATSQGRFDRLWAAVARDRYPPDIISASSRRLLRWRGNWRLGSREILPRVRMRMHSAPHDEPAHGGAAASRRRQEGRICPGWYSRGLDDSNEAAPGQTVVRRSSVGASAAPSPLSRWAAPNFGLRDRSRPNTSASKASFSRQSQSEPRPAGFIHLIRSRCLGSRHARGFAVHTRWKRAPRRRCGLDSAPRARAPPPLERRDGPDSPAPLIPRKLTIERRCLRALYPAIPLDLSPRGHSDRTSPRELKSA